MDPHKPLLPPTPPPVVPSSVVSPTGDNLSAEEHTPPTPQAATDPGNLFGIISFAFFLVAFGLGGLIIGIIGYKQSRKAGFPGTLSKVAIILNSLSIILVTAFFIFVLGKPLVDWHQTCQKYGVGEHEVGDMIYTCGNDGGGGFRDKDYQEDFR